MDTTPGYQLISSMIEAGKSFSPYHLCYIEEKETFDYYKNYVDMNLLVGNELYMSSCFDNPLAFSFFVDLMDQDELEIELKKTTEVVAQYSIIRPMFDKTQQADNLGRHIQNLESAIAKRLRDRLIEELDTGEKEGIVRRKM